MAPKDPSPERGTEREADRDDDRAVRPEALESEPLEADLEDVIELFVPEDEPEDEVRYGAQPPG